MAPVAAPHEIDRSQEELDGDAVEWLVSRAWDAVLRRPRLDQATFRGATFSGPIDFASVEFGLADFAGATFTGPVRFEAASFLQEALFASTTFEQSVSFRGARFDADARFEFADEEELAGRQEEVVFRGWADFTHVHFGGRAAFGGAQFERRARFNDVTCDADMAFTGATFASARTFGPVDARGQVDLDRATFEAPVRIRIRAWDLSCNRTDFHGRTEMDFEGIQVTLEEAEFSEPSLVSGRLSAEAPRLLSVRRANLANLTLANLDLRACSFLGATNLDKLRIEESPFSSTDEWWRTRRQVTADEIALRAPGQVAGLTPGRVEDAYRSLRKGREDNKDEPGSADFYYGEMEMRRRGSSGWERVILTLYWLASGYGLRASRAIAALAATVVLVAVGLAAFSGFDPDQGFWKSLLFSAESTSSLFRAPDPPNGATLNDEGHVFQMTLRLLGPLFIGLALLALRGRVKR
jgi:uncharacterized protein YjbI with pentapeptide repeats